MTDNYSLSDLLYLMRRLRNPKTGCPWDCEQTFKTIAPFTLEEVYEVVDTIEREDYGHLREELGDLLFQVIFYCQLGQEQELYDFNDVVHQLVAKLVARHPHVFPEGTLQSERDADVAQQQEKIKQTWEAIKREDRERKGKQGVLADIPRNFPALVRAQKVQKRAASVGFDWSEIAPVLDKLEEEIDELREAIHKNDARNIAEEFGDLLFSCVNLGRHLKQDSETSLREATRKFEQRFQTMEKIAASSGENLDNMTPDELESLWLRAKAEPAS